MIEHLYSLEEVRVNIVLGFIAGAIFGIGFGLMFK